MLKATFIKNGKETTFKRIGFNHHIRDIVNLLRPRVDKNTRMIIEVGDRVYITSRVTRTIIPFELTQDGSRQLLQNRQVRYNLHSLVRL